MLIYHKDIDPLYFIHIPRTGGRYLRELFIKNQYIVNHWNFNEYFFNKVVPHLQYPYYSKFTNYGKIKQFTLVRNPVDRFVSMFCAGIIKDKLVLNKNKILNNKNLLFEFIENNINNINSHTNWFLPQHHFLNNNCKIWKIENGLGNKFYKWMETSFKIKFKNKDIRNNYKTDYDFNKKIKLGKKTIEYIKEFYKHDYKLLDYK
jgi:hypothetical protein